MDAVDEIVVSEDPLFVTDVLLVTCDVTVEKPLAVTDIEFPPDSDSDGVKLTLEVTETESREDIDIVPLCESVLRGVCERNAVADPDTTALKLIIGVSVG